MSSEGSHSGGRQIGNDTFRRETPVSRCVGRQVTEGMGGGDGRGFGIDEPDRWVDQKGG